MRGTALRWEQLKTRTISQPLETGGGFGEDVPELWCPGSTLNIPWPLTKERHGLGHCCSLTLSPSLWANTIVRPLWAAAAPCVPLPHFHWKDGRWEAYAPTIVTETPSLLLQSFIVCHIFAQVQD